MYGYNFNSKKVTNALDVVTKLVFRATTNCPVTKAFNANFKPEGCVMIDGVWRPYFDVTILGEIGINPHNYKANEGQLTYGTARANFTIVGDVFIVSTFY